MSGWGKSESTPGGGVLSAIKDTSLYQIPSVMTTVASANISDEMVMTSPGSVELDNKYIVCVNG
jgi:hypothetical protein